MGRRGLIAVLIYTLDHAGTLALGCLSVILYLCVTQMIIERIDRIPHSKVYSCAFFGQSPPPRRQD